MPNHWPTFSCFEHCTWTKLMSVFILFWATTRKSCSLLGVPIHVMWYRLHWWYKLAIPLGLLWTVGWQPLRVVVLNDLWSFVGFWVLRQKLHLDLLCSTSRKQCTGTFTLLSLGDVLGNLCQQECFSFKCLLVFVFRLHSLPEFSGKTRDWRCAEHHYQSVCMSGTGGCHDPLDSKCHW